MSGDRLDYLVKPTPALFARMPQVFSLHSEEGAVLATFDREKPDTAVPLALTAAVAAQLRADGYEVQPASAPPPEPAADGDGGWGLDPDGKSKPQAKRKA